MRDDAQRGIIVDCHVDVSEPRRAQEVHGLGDDRVEAQHLPQEPAVEGAGVAVPRHAVVGVVEELVGQAPRLPHRLVLFVDVVVQVRRGKVRLVADVHDGADARAVGAEVLLGRVRLEDVVESGLEGVGPAHERDQGLDVVRHHERVLERRGFVADRVPLAPTAQGGVVAREVKLAVLQARGEKAREGGCGVDAHSVAGPVVLPLRRAVEVLLRVLGRLPERDLVQGEVVEGVFDAA